MLGIRHIDGCAVDRWRGNTHDFVCDVMGRFLVDKIENASSLKNSSIYSTEFVTELGERAVLDFFVPTSDPSCPSQDWSVWKLNCEQALSEVSKWAKKNKQDPSKPLPLHVAFELPQVEPATVEHIVECIVDCLKTNFWENNPFRRITLIT